MICIYIHTMENNIILFPGFICRVYYFLDNDIYAILSLNAVNKFCNELYVENIKKNINPCVILIKNTIDYIPWYNKFTKIVDISNPRIISMLYNDKINKINCKRIIYICTSYIFNDYWLTNTWLFDDRVNNILIFYDKHKLIKQKLHISLLLIYFRNKSYKETYKYINDRIFPLER